MARQPTDSQVARAPLAAAALRDRRVLPVRPDGPAPGARMPAAPPQPVLPRPLSDLESLLRLLIAEHQKLLGLLEEQQAAIRGLQIKRMEELAEAQEACRQRIESLEHRRRLLVGQLGTAAGLGEQASIASLAEAYPAARGSLLALRGQLRDLATRISGRAQLAGRVAGAVLGHLNTVVRLVAGDGVGLYTRQGVPRLAPRGVRVGIMEAMG
jgi:hypothetical protein